MACGTCEEVRAIDNIAPDCETERGCLIPKLSEDERRVMTTYMQLNSAADMFGPGLIMQHNNISRSDLELLLFVNQEVDMLTRERKK